MIGRLLILLLGLALFEAGVVQSMCKRNFLRDYKDGRYANCPPGKDPCEKRSLKMPNKSPMPCCRSEKKMKGTDNDCWVYFPKDGRRSLGDNEALNTFAEGLGVPEADRANLKKGLDRLAAANIDAKEIGNAESAKKMQEDAGASSRRMFGGLGGLGGLAGLGGIFGGSGGGFGGIPKCPVRVKLCYRVPCGHDPYMQTDPHRCLSDRRCCFDYILAWVRSIFGPRYMGGAPACYFGPTSKQWMYITSFFQPWNFWYTSFILDSFEDLFNTNAFKFGNKFLCEIDFGRKAYPVGSESKLQCNLVEGCWDETLPSGSQCLMAADFIQQMFGGQRQIYPSLFTNDPADTHCSANWFDFGPKAYNRLPCGVGPPPPKIFDMLFKWCPINDCCLNYASLSASQRTQLSLLSLMGGNSGFGGAPGGFGGALGGLGGAPGGFNIGALSQLGPFSGGSQPSPFGGGFPLPNQGSTPVNSQLFQYLLTGSASDDLEELFCPYRSILGSSLFPDMSEDTDGCCDIPSCYHKKKLVSGGPGPRPPHPSPPQPPHHQPHRWGQWSECSYTCGPGGQQSRTCYSGNTPGPPHGCPGQATQPCQQQQPCPVRARWGPWSECSPTCGEGTMSRICYSGNTNTPQDPSYCGGPNTQRCNGPPCQQYPQWGQWRLESECSATCGHGFTRYGRGCFTGSQQVNPSRCSGGHSQSTKSEPCNAGPCRPDPIWGAWGPCSEECGIGSRTRPCYSGSTPRPPSECSGPGTEQCQERPCPPPAQWGRWGDCSVSCGQGRRTRPCVSGNQPQPPSYCNGPATQSCQMGACRPNAAWGPWQTYAPCGATCGPKGIKMQRRQCLYENGGVAAPALCGSGPSVQPIQCGAPQCPDECYCSAWVEGQCQRQGGRCMRQDRRWCYQKRPNGQLYTDNKCRGEITETRTCGPC